MPRIKQTMKLIGPQANVAFGEKLAGERAVTPSLRRHFSKVWHLGVPSRGRLDVSILPDGCADLVWLDGSLHVLGPGSVWYPESVPPGSRVVAFRFNLGIGPTWLGVRAGDIVDGTRPLDELNVRLASTLSKAIGDVSDVHEVVERLEAALVQVSSSCPSPSPCMTGVTAILEAAHFTPGRLLPQLQALTNLSERSVRRETERFFGFGPKRLERVVRLQRFLELKWNRIHDDLATLAAAAGYSDQSHLTRETRALTGMTPKTLVSLCFEMPSPVRAS